jgi:hypothetical protein
MKNFLLLFALLCIAFATRAQFTTGQKMISGQLSGGFKDNLQNSGSQIDRGSDVFLSLSLSKFKSPTVSEK